MTRLLSCREFVDFVWAYLSGEVSSEERSEFELHLALCPSCVAYMANYQKTVELGKLAFSDDAEAGDAVPPDVPEELIDAILAARRRPSLPSPSA